MRAAARPIEQQGGLIGLRTLGPRALARGLGEEGLVCGFKRRVPYGGETYYCKDEVALYESASVATNSRAFVVTAR